ncbi:hypothetical protein [Aliarcobacter thereius]|uniref:Uncharacterized protein n=2 Tax=Aliarcobacter thereius TaxID=544718 RepID=A0A1C0B626_9BACT|nr:hypothetical protein [Aliarcobacter thereius]OCL96460.1 hypothetical protein AA347_01951 [Aliarcobacter thereius LMG 24486]OCL98580.1 hypothetical protein AAX29_01493 [Aliarcobacter thereius]TLS71560.1 hypothetical protein FE246_08080 [Aliarcobacter thereius]TLS91674.1 hypothetical protein FE244_08480 [Aliarcobacter thereius]HJE03739.1 hypothetical protein [Aliarcobacter thereius]
MVYKKMKKAYILLSTLFFVLLFSFIAKQSLEKNALNSRVYSEKLYFIQAKAHIYFLEQYLLRLNENELLNFISLEFMPDNFILKISKKDEKEYFLSVKNEEFGVKISKLLKL